MSEFSKMHSGNLCQIALLNMWLLVLIDLAYKLSSVVRQKGESQNGCFKKIKHAKFFEKEHFLPLDIATLLLASCAYQGVLNVRFSENLACFVFLKHPFWDSSFCLITDVIWRREIRDFILCHVLLKTILFYYEIL